MFVSVFTWSLFGCAARADETNLGYWALLHAIVPVLKLPEDRDGCTSRAEVQGAQEAFSCAALKIAMWGESKRHTAACCIWWYDPRCNTSPGVPILKSSVRQFAFSYCINRAALEQLKLVMPVQDALVDANSMKRAFCVWVLLFYT